MSSNLLKGSFFRNAFNAVIAARERQAQLYVSRMNLHGTDFRKLGDQ